MNNSYKIIWSDIHQSFISVSEITKGKSKGGVRAAKVLKTTLMCLMVTCGGFSIAQSTCVNVGSAIDIFTPETDQCSLKVNDALTIKGGGSINYVGTNGYGGAIDIRNASDSITIESTGQVSAYNTGVGGTGGVAAIFMSNGSLANGLTNSGSVSGLNTGTANYKDGIYMTGSTISGGLTNNVGGIISGREYGIILLNGSIINGGIKNYGEINHSGFAGISIAGGFNSDSTVNGGIVNTGTVGGIRLENVFSYGGILNGGLRNTGTISGDIQIGSNGEVNNSSNAIYNNGGSITGKILNNGAITSTNENGISLYNSTLGGNIENNGSISAGVESAGIASYGSVISGKVLNGVNGSINSGLTGAALSFIDSTIVGGIDNAGRINGVNNDDYAIYSTGTNLSIENKTTGVISGRVEVLGGVGNVFNNSGTLILPVGISNFTGNFTNASGAVFSPSIVSNSSYASLHVDGNINLSGILKANNGVNVDGLIAGTLEGVITYTGTRVGSFTSIVGANSLFTWRELDVDEAKRVDLGLSAGSTGYLASVDAAKISSARGAAAALDLITANNVSNPTTLRFINVSQDNVAKAVQQTLPLLTGGSLTVASGVLSSVNKVIQARQSNVIGLSSGDKIYGDEKAWLKPFGNWARQSDIGGVSGYKSTSDGFVVGADRSINAKDRVGFAFAYINSNANGNNFEALQNTNTTMYQLIGYGSHALENHAEINYQFDIGVGNNKGKRIISLLDAVATASYNTSNVHIGIGYGKSLYFASNDSFTPSIRIDYTGIKDAGYSEAGADALNLNVDSRSNNSLVINLNGNYTHKITEGNLVFANIGLGYDAINKNSGVLSSFAGEPSIGFTTFGLERDPWMINAGFGFTSNVRTGLEVTARYDVQYSQQFVNQMASLKARWVF